MGVSKGGATRRSDRRRREPFQAFVLAFFDRMFLLSDGRRVAFFDDSDVSGVAD